MSSENIVKLNIGGTIFQTSKSTLTKFDGLFKTMLETRGPTKKDDSGCIFIDRSSKHFELILNFMRDDVVVLPDSTQDVQEIQKEAQYYQLQELVKLCTDNLQFKIRIIESDSQLLQTIADVKEKPVCIVYLYLPSNGFYKSYPDFEFKHFLEKHKDTMDIYFKPFHEVSSEEMGGTKCHYQLYNSKGLIFKNLLEHIEIDLKFLKVRSNGSYY